MIRAALLAAVLCAGSAVAPCFAQTAQPQRERPAADTDEAGLWRQSDLAEREAQASSQIERDPALNEYLSGVICRIASEYCRDLRLYVRSVPLSNAFMSPNGYAEIWAGMLLDVDDEAQLAFVLGHEATHYIDLHSLNGWRATKTRAGVAMVLSAGVAVTGYSYSLSYPELTRDILNATGSVIDSVQLAGLALVFAYNRDQEENADEAGFRRAVAAGYDPSAGSVMWTNMMAAANASSIPAIRNAQAHSSLFNTHPVTASRARALERQARDVTANGETYRERYRAAIRPHLDAWLQARLRTRDYGHMLHTLERMGAHGEDGGVIEFYRGEVYRLRRQSGDLALAKERYIAALTYMDAPARAWRELGDIRARDGDRAEAANCLRFYLEKAPNAEDRALVEARIASLTQGASP